MNKDTDKTYSSSADGIPVLREVVMPTAEDIPTLDPAQAVRAAPVDLISPALLHQLTDTLHLALSRELDYAIDGAVYQRLQTAMEEVAAEVKTTLHAQLEQIIPQPSRRPSSSTPHPKNSESPRVAAPTHRYTTHTLHTAGSFMDKTYEPHAIEHRWYHSWEQGGYFAPQGKGAPYCIMIPPPNVTGSQHMGHAFQDTLMDALTRYHRMRGDNTLWQPGTDLACIATQMVVERQLAAQGKSRHDLGREQFIDAVWKWKAESGGTITRQLRRLGASLDWSRERFTMDEGLSEAVREVFVRLYEEGLIYRGKRLVNWDPVLHTAVSDLEVISEEENGQLWHLRYPLADGSGYLIVATTRPETMLGDAAVAVHPEDERYS